MGFGKAVGISQVWQDSDNHRVFKSFVEYHDTHTSQLAFERLAIMEHPADCSLKVDFCCLCHHERQEMFFTKPVAPGPLPKWNPPEEPTQNGRHQHSNSTLSNGFLVINEDPLGCPGPAPEDCPDANGTGYELDMDRIASGKDRRTTCMIRNIPNKYSQQMLIDFLDESHEGRYDFIYLRMDFKNKCNVGYAFINFLNPLDILSFAQRMLGKRWPKFNSEKVCALAYARIQGKSALVDKFRNSRVMQEPPSYRPKVFTLKP